jgi:tetratricopeptide (TPR) repeat protein
VPGLVFTAGSIILCPEVWSLPSYDIKGTPSQKRLQSLSDQISANPKDPKPYIDRAEFWVDYMMLTRARADIDSSIGIVPTGAAYVWLAKLSIDPNKPSDNKMACVYLKKARSVSSNDLQGLIRTANAYTQFKMFDRSVECYDDALKLRPGDLNLIDWKAINLMKEGHFKDAIVAATYVLSKLPPKEKIETLKKVKVKENSMQFTLFKLHADAYKTRGISLLKLHSYAVALPDLNTALELAPGDEQLLKARSEVYLKLGKPDLAEIDLRNTKGDIDFLFENAPFASGTHK